ncbi:HotDog domain-containing protein [Coniella lustricola]|uniref:HotDog domain-containing protein n=1 Tax=Coniella lustricola TaxID=2025994 RepID=A0A2T3AKA3_9PEZI|nr:HotDog domain-containing protein [Coniella lustricola]
MPNSEKTPSTRLTTMYDSLLKVDGAARLQKWMEMSEPTGHSWEDNDWMSHCMPHIKLHSWSTEDPKHARVVFSYEVPRHNSNQSGNMHGGCTATLFDFATSMPLCLVSKPGFWFYMGVSRTLNVTYARAIPVGEKIFIECEIMSIGQTLCTVRGVMRRQSDGVVLATCEHGKFNTDPPVQSQRSSKM